MIKLKEILQGVKNSDSINEGKSVGVIYHYTDKKGLDGILKSNSIKSIGILCFLE